MGLSANGNNFLGSNMVCIYVQYSCTLHKQLRCPYIILTHYGLYSMELQQQEVALYLKEQILNLPQVEWNLQLATSIVWAVLYPEV